ncbi:MAG: hypothetical protein ACLUHG_02890 [Sutterella wadsworthensis]
MSALLVVCTFCLADGTFNVVMALFWPPQDAELMPYSRGRASLPDTAPISPTTRRRQIFRNSFFKFSNRQVVPAEVTYLVAQI